MMSISLSYIISPVPPPVPPTSPPPSILPSPTPTIRDPPPSPVPVIQPQQVELQPGQNFTLNCSTDVVAIIHWEYEFPPGRLPENVNIRTINNRLSELTITNFVTDNNTGRYRCIATAGVNENSTTAFVIPNGM